MNEERWQQYNKVCRLADRAIHEYNMGREKNALKDLAKINVLIKEMMPEHFPFINNKPSVPTKSN